jgi:predicted nucleic acid-binding protein
VSPVPRGRPLLDTSVYIRHARDSSHPWIENPDIIQRSILTVVVAAELYAGARNPEDKRDLDALCRWHRALGSLSSPDSGAWLDAGQFLGRYIRLHGALAVANHFRDILIALEAVRHQATLLTENIQDFLRWQKVLRASGRNLAVFTVPN